MRVTGNLNVVTSVRVGRIWRGKVVLLLEDGSKVKVSRGDTVTIVGEIRMGPTTLRTAKSENH